MKNPRMYDVTISRPLARLSTLPQMNPRKAAIGMLMIDARTSPGIPTTAQSVTKIRPICPAIAPSTMPKLSPIPAMIGTSSDNTRKELRARRVIIS